MHGACGNAGAAHNTGIHIVKLRVGMVLRLCPSREIPMRRPSRRYQPGMHVTDLLPERRHVHNQVLDHRHVTKRRDRDVPMPFQFFAEGGAAGQLLTAVDRHRAGAANRRAAGIAERQTPVALVLDANQRIEHRHPAPDVETDLLRMGNGIDFGIESLNREGEAHGRRSAFSSQPSAS